MTSILNQTDSIRKLVSEKGNNAMEIKLNFDDNQINDILEKENYIVEDVMMYYPLDYDDEQYLSYNVKVAYHMMDDVGWKHEDKPLMSDYVDYKYENVVSKLINKALVNCILTNT